MFGRSRVSVTDIVIADQQLPLAPAYHESDGGADDEEDDDHRHHQGQYQTGQAEAAVIFSVSGYQNISDSF